MQWTVRFLIVAVVVAAGQSVASASGATFRLSAVGAELGKPNDEAAEIPRYKLKIKAGTPFTLVAEGVVFPRGGRPAPGDVDAGAWLFDDEAFKLIPADGVDTDKTKVVIGLTGLKPGRWRVRFVGDILGRYHKYDVQVEVTER